MSEVSILAARHHNARVMLITDLDRAREEIARVGASPESIDIMAPKSVFKVVKVEDVPLKAAIILKQEMLAKGGEAAIAWGVAGLKVEATDVVLSGTIRQLRMVCEALQRQPFGLKHISREITEAIEASMRGPVVWKCRGREVPIGGKTYVMGILNVTPDSFSDGGEAVTLEQALAKAERLIEEGADILDIGGESTRPGADPVPLEEELRRVVPVAQAVASRSDALISVDTYKPEVARRAVLAGAHIINDITGLGDPEMARVAAETGAGVVIMHIKGEPRTMQEAPQYDDVVSEVMEFLRDRIDLALDAGVDRASIAIDPGIGFGKTVEHNLEILSRLEEFTSIGCPILIGTSRKSTIGKVLNLPVNQRVEGTAATVALGIAKGADIVRVHDVLEMARVAKMADAILRR